MPGDVWQKAANLRAYFAFMWTHPGKKLLFMGGEFGQWREWNHDTSLDWHLLNDGPFHKGIQSVLRDLNHLYREQPALHERDCEPDGFEWIDCTDSDNSVFAFLRWNQDRSRHTVTVSNFTPLPRQGYRIGVPRAGAYRERINTDAGVYGGSGVGNAGQVWAEEIAASWPPCVRVPDAAAAGDARPGADTGLTSPARVRPLGRAACSRIEVRRIGVRPGDGLGRTDASSTRPSTAIGSPCASACIGSCCARATGTTSVC